MPQSRLQTYDDTDMAVMEAELERDLARARQWLGSDSVQCAELVSGWRVRVLVPLSHLSGDEAGVPFITTAMGNAWGVDPDMPLTVELHCPQSGYKTVAGTTPDFINSVFQDGFEGFLPGKQLLLILREFTADYLGLSLHAFSDMTEDDSDFAKAELKAVGESNQKKIELMSSARSDPAL
eukprot:3107193-Amphidinium_carterae.1